MGCWLLTQSDAGITPQEGPTVIATLFASMLAFLAALAGSTFLGHRKHGLRVVLRNSLLLAGTGGLCVLVFFIVTSKGLIFRFGALPSVVLIVSAVFVVLFWRTVPSSQNARS